MHRYRAKGLGALCAAIVLLVAGCSVPTSKENVAATAQLVAPQSAAPLLWRRDQEADKQARASVEAMLVDGLTVEEAAAVAFLASPELQLALEQLEISRAQLVAASTLPNPIGVVGSRSPGGNWASFYPGHTLTLGVMQNVIGLLNVPARRAVAIRDLDRARFQAAEDCTRLAARVVQAWLEYSCAAARWRWCRRHSTICASSPRKKHHPPRMPPPACSIWASRSTSSSMRRTCCSVPPRKWPPVANAWVSCWR
jgi:hypothetical protein